MKTKIWIARNGDGSLFAFKNEPHRLLKNDTGIKIWYDHLHSFKMNITKEYNWKYKNLEYEDEPVMEYITEDDEGNITLTDEEEIGKIADKYKDEFLKENDIEDIDKSFYQGMMFGFKKGFIRGYAANNE